MVKACIFDLGNTLIEYPTPEELKGNCMKNISQMLREVDEKLLDRMQEILKEDRTLGMKTLKEATVKKALTKVFKEKGIRLNNSKAMILMDDIYYFGFGKYTKPVSGDLELLKFLKSLGIKMGIVSNTPFPGSMFRLEMEKWRQADYFQSFVWSSEFGKRKPSPDIFRKALEELRVSPEEAVFVGDKMDRDVIGARGVGMKAIWFDRKGKPDDRTLIPPNGPNTYRVLSLAEIMSLDLFR